MDGSSYGAGYGPPGWPYPGAVMAGDIRDYQPGMEPYRMPYCDPVTSTVLGSGGPVPFCAVPPYYLRGYGYDSGAYNGLAEGPEGVNSLWYQGFYRGYEGEHGEHQVECTDAVYDQVAIVDEEGEEEEEEVGDEEEVYDEADYGDEEDEQEYEEVHDTGPIREDGRAIAAKETAISCNGGKFSSLAHLPICPGGAPGATAKQGGATAITTATTTVMSKLNAPKSVIQRLNPAAPTFLNPSAKSFVPPTKIGAASGSGPLFTQPESSERRSPVEAATVSPNWEEAIGRLTLGVSHVGPVAGTRETDVTGVDDSNEDGKAVKAMSPSPPLPSLQRLPAADDPSSASVNGGSESARREQQKQEPSSSFSGERPPIPIPVVASGAFRPTKGASEDASLSIQGSAQAAAREETSKVESQLGKDLTAKSPEAGGTEAVESTRRGESATLDMEAGKSSQVPTMYDLPTISSPLRQFITGVFSLFQGPRGEHSMESLWWCLETGDEGLAAAEDVSRKAAMPSTSRPLMQLQKPPRILGPYSCEQMILAYIAEALPHHVRVCGTRGSVPPASMPPMAAFEPLGLLLNAAEEGKPYSLL